MTSSTIRLDRSLYGDEAIARTAHGYTGQFQVSLHDEGTQVRIVLAPFEGGALPAGLEARFLNDALDQRLRQLVREETRSIHEELIRAALREASPRYPDTDQ